MKKNKIESSLAVVHTLQGWVLTGTKPHDTLHWLLLCGKAGAAIALVSSSPALLSWVIDVGQLIEEKMPSCCWGSEEKTAYWLETNGFGGLPDQKQVELKLSGDFDYWLNPQ